MKTIRGFLLLLGCVLLSACGPISGQLMKSSEGLKDYRVTQGDLTGLRGIENLLVVGPFIGKGAEAQVCVPKADCLYPDNMDIKFVSKYNDARRFAQGLQEADFFKTELYLVVDYARINETVNRLKSLSSLEIKNEFALKSAPEGVLIGVVKKRDLHVAPRRGVVVDVEYELEFYQPDSRQSIVIEVAVAGVFKDDLKAIIQETKRRLAVM